MNKIDLRMMYKADTGYWPVHIKVSRKRSFSIDFTKSYLGYPKREYLRWLEQFFPTNIDLFLKWKREYKYMPYTQWLEEYVLEQIDELQLVLKLNNEK